MDVGYKHEICHRVAILNMTFNCSQYHMQKNKVMIDNEWSDTLKSLGRSFISLQITNLRDPLHPNPQSRGFYVSKINGLTGDDIWVQQGITTGIGQWTKDIYVDANATVYLTGYLNGTIDFQQGDTWDTGFPPPPPGFPPTPAECDNTYIIKVYDGQNQGIIERLSNSTPPVNETISKQHINKVPILNYWTELFNVYPELQQQQYYIYDMTGKEMFRGDSKNAGLLSNAILENGMYLLRLINSNKSFRFILIK